MWLFLTIKAVNKDAKRKKNANNHVHNILRLFDSFPFATGEIKRDYQKWTGIYDLSNELQNDLRLRTLWNLEKSGKSKHFIELLPSA